VCVRERDREREQVRSTRGPVPSLVCLCEREGERESGASVYNGGFGPISVMYVCVCVCVCVWERERASVHDEGSSPISFTCV